jgi:hypothetical protein
LNGWGGCACTSLGISRNIGIRIGFHLKDGLSGLYLSAGIRIQNSQELVCFASSNTCGNGQADFTGTAGGLDILNGTTVNAVGKSVGRRSIAS